MATTIDGVMTFTKAERDAITANGARVKELIDDTVSMASSGRCVSLKYSGAFCEMAETATLLGEVI